MKLKILAEGSTKWRRFIKHWGLSILIDDDILFDTFGKPDYVLRQLKRFKIDINKIKHIVISHDDWDHVTGLDKILERNKNVTVYICPHFKPDIKAKIRHCGARIVEVDGVTNIRDNIYLSGELTGKRRDSNIPEQYLAVKTAKGIIVLTGCAHPGIIEIVQHAKAAFNMNAYLIMGGFHLKDHTVEEIHKIVLKLKELGVCQVIPFHCTGRNAQQICFKEYSANCFAVNEGQSIEV
ncbi:MAG: MBL fold metallo-hydrolase [Candidatus Omnitrophica bacterium]|nr:MBL fold metallo-hydrolase [Candidatus Omnitrophota bacterium]